MEHSQSRTSNAGKLERATLIPKLVTLVPLILSVLIDLHPAPHSPSIPASDTFSKSVTSNFLQMKFVLVGYRILKQTKKNNITDYCTLDLHNTSQASASSCRRHKTFSILAVFQTMGSSSKKFSLI